MPPRRRVGLKRMDAAVDALKPMGFPPELIRRKVKELLKTYGEEGWVFIEDASYKVLIECILEEQEQGEPSSRDSQNDDVRSQGGGEAERSEDQGGGEAERSEATPLIEGSEATCSNVDTASATTPVTDTSLVAPMSDVPLENHSLELKPASSPAENVPTPSKIAASNEVPQTNGMFIDQELNASSNEDSTLSGPPGFEHFSRLQLGYESRKRRPSLGWMDPNEDQTFVLLEPAPVVGWKTQQRPRKRKSRWDVAPDVV